MQELDVQSYIAEALGWRELATGRLLSIAQEQDLEITKLWLASISYWEFSNTAYISVVTSNKWCKAVVLVPRLKEDSIQYVKLEKDITVIEVIELNDWRDPVEVALNNVNIMYDDGFYGVARGRGVYAFSLFVHTWVTFCHFSVHRTSNEGHATLWRALRQASYELAQMCKHKDIHRFFDTMPDYLFEEFKQDNQTED